MNSLEDVYTVSTDSEESDSEERNSGAACKARQLAHEKMAADAREKKAKRKAAHNARKLTSGKSEARLAADIQKVNKMIAKYEKQNLWWEDDHVALDCRSLDDAAAAANHGMRQCCF